MDLSPLYMWSHPGFVFFPMAETSQRYSPLKKIRDAPKSKKAAQDLVVHNSVVNTFSGEMFYQLSTDLQKKGLKTLWIETGCIAY